MSTISDAIDAYNDYQDSAGGSSSSSGGSTGGGYGSSGGGSISPDPMNETTSKPNWEKNVTFNKDGSWVTEIGLVKESDRTSVKAEAFHAGASGDWGVLDVRLDLVQLEGMIAEDVALFNRDVKWGLGGPEVSGHLDSNDISIGAHAAEASFDFGNDASITFYAGGHLGYNRKENRVKFLIVEFDFPDSWW